MFWEFENSIMGKKIRIIYLPLVATYYTTRQSEILYLTVNIMHPPVQSPLITSVNQERPLVATTHDHERKETTGLLLKV